MDFIFKNQGRDIIWKIQSWRLYGSTSYSKNKNKKLTLKDSRGCGSSKLKLPFPLQFYGSVRILYQKLGFYLLKVLRNSGRRTCTVTDVTVPVSYGTRLLVPYPLTAVPSYCRYLLSHYFSMQSAQFEDFLVEFLNRCFAIIENSIVLETRAEVHIAPHL